MKQLLLILLAIMLLVFACEDSESINDPLKNQLDDYGELYRDTLTAINSTFIEHGKVNTGSSTKLLLGSYDGFECRFLIKFNPLSGEDVVLDSIFLLLNTASNYGPANSEFEGKIYLVTEEWNSAVNIDEDWNYENSISLSSQTSSQFTCLPEDSTDYNILLPDTLVSIWNDTSNGGNNFGLLLDFENANYIKEFESGNSSNGPQLIFKYHDSANDSIRNDTVGVSIDASLIDFDGNIQSDSLIYIVSGYTYYSFVEFNLDSIPENVVISNVNFVFMQDTLNSKVNENLSQNFYLRTVKTPFADLPEYTADSTFVFNSFYNISLSEINNALEISNSLQGYAGQYFTQSILNKDIEYGSFLLNYVGEGITVSKFAIKGANEFIKKNNRPKMIIEYFKIPQSRI
jgi:hypothetical protein